jgi:uncharacterized protein
MSYLDQAAGSRLPLPLRIVLLSALFVGVATLFARLLQPFVEPGTAAAAAQVAGAGVPAPLAAAPIKTLTTSPALPPEPTPYAPEHKGPRIAIVLTDVGDNPAHARAAIEALPAAIGLAFTPYPDVRALGKAARADGHEVWAGLPMQPRSWPRVSPGKNTLLVRAEAADNLKSLDWALARVEGAVGVTGIMGSAFTESAPALRPVLAEVGKRRLAYLDARASGRSVGVATAREAGVRAAANDRFLDESGSLTANLAALELQARSQGSAIGYARPLPSTVAALQAWAPTLESKGILLVPPSTLAE